MALLLDDKSSSCKTPASSNGATYGSHQLSETPPHLSKDKTKTKNMDYKIHIVFFIWKIKNKNISKIFFIFIILKKFYN